MNTAELRAAFEDWHARNSNDPGYRHATDKGRAWLAVVAMHQAAGGELHRIPRPGPWPAPPAAGGDHQAERMPCGRATMCAGVCKCVPF